PVLWKCFFNGKKKNDIGPVTLTSDPAVFQRELRELYVQVVFVLTGDCGDRTHPGYLAYEEIAATSSGQVFHLDKQQVTEVLKWVESALQASKVHLLSTDHEEGGEHTWKIPFDPSLKEVTISLSGPGPEIEVRDPLGRILQRDDGLNVLLSIPDSAKVVAFKPEHSGLWSIKPSLDLNHTIEWPLQGVPISLVINSTGLRVPGRLDSVELSHSSGQSLLTLPTQPLSNGSTHQLWGGPPFHSPQERFYLKVKGKDHEGNPLLRVSGVSYRGVIPAQGRGSQRLPVCGGPPPQLVPVPNVTVSPGETAILSCLVLSEAPYNLTWVRDWRVLSASTGRVTQLADLSLEVRNTTPSDGGRYQCMASNSNGVTRASVWLLVREAPQVSIHTRSQRFSQGMEVRVRCSASGYPAPHISWSREGRALQEDSRVRVDAQGTLIIQGVAPEDAGSYSCQAANEIGRDEETVTLYYTDPPSVSAVNGVVLAAKGEEAVLECEATGVPPPRVIWYRDAPQLLELPQDVTVELGRSALLACRATGHPPPTITWHRGDDQPLGPRPGSRSGWSDSGVLFFESVVPEDQALYVCEAENVFGKVQAEAYLLVTGHVPPQIASSAPTVRVLERQPVSLPCIVLAGRPRPERRWLKAGMPLPPGSRHSIRADGSLHLDQALLEDAGRYSCVVSNTAGSHHRDVQLVVQVPPRIQPTATHHITNEGVPASLPCVASGVPTPTITWTKETNALASRDPHYNVSKDGTLVIPRPSVQDAGAYVCTATNAVGFSSQEMRLSVNTKPRILVNGSHEADKPLRVTAKAGDEVTLDCEAQGSPPPLVTWTKDSRHMLPITDRHHLLPPGSLHLAQAQVSDSGLYECTASNPAGSATQYYILRVQVPPQVQPGPRVLKVLVGEAVDLNCVAEGSPEPRVTWSKDGPPHWGADETSGLLERVAGENASLPCPARGTPKPQVTWRKGPSSEPLRDRPGLAVLDEGSLFLASVSPSDGGDYECQATNEAGSASRRAKLVVHVPPSLREDGRRANVSGMAGQSLMLECDANGFPAPEITWLKNGRQIPAVGSHRLLDGARALHFPRIQEGDSGLYSCRAENQAGTAQRDFDLLVLIPPSVLGAEAAQEVVGLAGAGAELECRTSGVPTPQVEWTKDGQPVFLGEPHVQLQEDGQVLRITNSHLGDEGWYQCVAFSPAGQQTKDFQLRIHAPPTIWGSNETSEVAVMEGHPVWFLCEARGVPTPDITWFKDGDPLVPSTEVVYSRGGRQLQLERAQGSDAGTYSCKASNAVGVVEKTTRLEVYVPPTIEGTGEGPRVVKAVAGRPLTLECVARGYPPPTVSWYHEGLPVVDRNGTWLGAGGGVLSLESLGEASGGLYSCVASSPAGEAVLHYSVEVQVAPQLLVAEGLGQVTTLVGQSLYLPCYASGSPVPTIQWLQNGHPAEELPGVQVTSEGTTLHIDHVELGHAGLFACQATNEAGTAAAEVELSVHVPPNIEPGLVNKAVLENASVTLECLASGVPPPVPPRITLPPSLPGPVLLHSPVRLTCDAAGAPSPMLMWLKDGNPVSTAGTAGLQVFPGGRVLMLASARVSDSGSYSCVAVSAVGEDRRDVVLRVHSESRA
ncbi:Hemicentin-2, partial [Bos mutus]